MSYLSDIEIAQATEMAPIVSIAAKLGIEEDELDLYGKYKARSHSAYGRGSRTGRTAS